jgi:hypothetical protein
MPSLVEWLTLRRPPTFIPGIPSCQPTIRPAQGGTQLTRHDPMMNQTARQFQINTGIVNSDSLAGTSLSAVTNYVNLQSLTQLVLDLLENQTLAPASVPLSTN